MPHMPATQVKKIYFNGAIKQLAMDTMSYDEICQLAGYHPAQRPTVQFSQGVNNTSGTVLPGQRLSLVSSMVIDCVITSAT